jgi:hypothetical protein
VQCDICSVISFSTADFYPPQIDHKTNDVCKTANNVFGKCKYFTRVHIYSCVSVIVRDIFYVLTQKEREHLPLVLSHAVSLVMHIT